MNAVPVEEVSPVDAPIGLTSEEQVAIEALPVGTALLIAKRGPNVGARFLLDAPRTTVGRHPDSNIFLDDVTVSRKHAEFLLHEGKVTVVDVGSLNGTYVNREPVEERALDAGDEVHIGKYRLAFYPHRRAQ